MTELEKVIANLGYPVGMGVAPSPADLARMKSAIIEECAGMAEIVAFDANLITPAYARKRIAAAIRTLKGGRDG